MTCEMPHQTGKRAIVTGSNSGTGKAAARALASAGANVIMAVRKLDLADLVSIKDFVENLNAEERPLDLLLNNAGVMMLPHRYETADGFEMQFGTNFLGHFALTLRLLPLLLKAKAPRVVTMSSGNQAPIDFDNLNWERDYNPVAAYGRSKLADLLFSQQLARVSQKQGWNLLSLGAHPGNATTEIFKNGGQYGDKPILAIRIAWRITPRHSAAAGAAPEVYAATAPDVVQGGYYGPRFGLVGRPAKAKVSKAGQDEQVAARLWAEAERLTGVTIGS